MQGTVQNFESGPLIQVCIFIRLKIWPFLLNASWFHTFYSKFCLWLLVGPQVNFWNTSLMLFYLFPAFISYWLWVLPECNTGFPAQVERKKENLKIDLPFKGSKKKVNRLRFFHKCSNAIKFVLDIFRSDVMIYLCI